jgi:hypothetical protein
MASPKAEAARENREAAQSDARTEERMFISMSLAG